MAVYNKDYDNLAPSYLFSEIAKRTKAFEAATGQTVMRLGIGNTTEPFPPVIAEAIQRAGRELGTLEGYGRFGGYGDEQGMTALREAVAGEYARRGMPIKSKEVFIGDGAKSDLGNIQGIFAPGVIALQDPVYPAYLDVSAINGRTGSFDRFSARYAKVAYMPCTPENGFTPQVPKSKVDLVYLCSPNNPTGAVMKKRDLEKFVDYAQKNRAVIIFDAAYSSFISNPELVKSVYEVSGAEKCAIEVQSFSKSAGFTGLRLGWTVVLEALVCEDGGPGKLNQLWNRRQTTFFNGASNVAQVAGLAALTPEGKDETARVVDYYKINTGIIVDALNDLGLKVYGGTNAPYVWTRAPSGMGSWQFFDKLLQETRVVCTPGVGFGTCGEGFFRLSGFGHRENIQAAVDSIKKNLKL